ncbi:MAG: DUF5020 family protein [Bacteroidota bacterium]
MRKILLIFVFAATAFLTTNAQNIQLHYDLGEGRKFFTTTVEMFRPDSWGSTFFFIDMDYSAETRGIDNGISLAYWEIARAFKWNETQKIMPRVEFNGGILKLNGDNSPFIPIENVYIAGLERTWASADFSKIFTFQTNYKYIQGKEKASFQLTGVWTIQMLENKLTFAGFADFWKEEMDVWYDAEGNKKEKTDFRFLSEPQLWYNFNKNLAVGTEIELSSNFVDKGFDVMPTIGAKVTF